MIQYIIKIYTVKIKGVRLIQWIGGFSICI